MPCSTKNNAASLVDRFNEADLALLLAISCDDGIAEASRAFDTASRNLLNAEPEKPLEREHLARFIGERFLLSENANPETRQCALNPLITLVARGPV